jgi:hypothetical protein
LSMVSLIDGLGDGQPKALPALPAVREVSLR